MRKFRELFRRHALIVGLVAVAIPLVAHLWLQYQSLSELESTLPIARRANMRMYLSNVLNRVRSHYEQKAEETLNVPAGAFHHKYPNKDFKENAMDVERISAYLQQHRFNGARLLFTGIITGVYVPHYAMLRFYDPVSGALSMGNPDEFAAAQAAAANWISMTMTDSIPKSVRLTVDERDPKNR